MASEYANSLFKSIQSIANNATEALAQTLPEYYTAKIIKTQSTNEDIGAYVVQILGQNTTVVAQGSISDKYKTGDEVQIQKLDNKYLISGALTAQNKLDGFFNFYYDESLNLYNNGSGVVDKDILIKQLRAGGDTLYISTDVSQFDANLPQTLTFTITEIESGISTEIYTISISADDIEGDPYKLPSSSGEHCAFKFNINLPFDKICDSSRISATLDTANASNFSNIKVYIGKSDQEVFDYSTYTVYLYYNTTVEGQPVKPIYDGGELPEGWSWAPIQSSGSSWYIYMSSGYLMGGHYWDWSTPSEWATSSSPVSNYYIASSVVTLHKNPGGSGFKESAINCECFATENNLPVEKTVYWTYKIDNGSFVTPLSGPTHLFSLSTSSLQIENSITIEAYYDSTAVFTLATITIVIDASLPQFIADWDGQQTKIDGTSTLSMQAGFGQFLNPAGASDTNRGFIGVALGSIADSIDSAKNFSGIIGYNSTEDTSTNPSTYTTEETFRLNSANGEIVAKKGKIGGFKLDATTLTTGQKIVCTKNTNSTSWTMQLFDVNGISFISGSYSITFYHRNNSGTGTTGTATFNSNNEYIYTTSSGSTYNQISFNRNDWYGSNFDYNLNYTGLQNSLSKTFFAGATDATGTNAKFYVNIDGSVTASTGSIAGWNISPNEISKGNFILNSSSTNGSITAKAGSIGGWSLGDYTFSANSSAVGLYSGTATGNYIKENSAIRFWAGNSTPSKAKFIVTEDGSLYSNSGRIEGEIVATDLTIAETAIIPECNIATLGGTTQGTITGVTVKIGDLRIITGTGHQESYAMTITATKSSNKVAGTWTVGNYKYVRIKGALQGLEQWFTIDLPDSIFISTTGTMVSTFRTPPKALGDPTTGGFATSDTQTTNLPTSVSSQTLSTAESIQIKTNLVPSTTGSYTLGTSDNRWKEIWCTQTSINSSSDKNLKKDIEFFTNNYDKFFDSLKPVSYKFIDGESGRKHSGFIAQDVLEALQKNNLTPLDFAGYCYDKNKDGTERYGLRYGEFIALNTWQIQKLKTRVSELETQIQNLQNLLIQKGE